jgi:lipoate-protein ligase A
MLHALQSLGIRAELSGRNDILVDGRKVSGYAKRVYKDRLMVHGTLMYDVDIDCLTRVLTPPTEKLESKGIASVKSRVLNLRDRLPQFEHIGALTEALERYLSRQYQDAEYHLTAPQLAEIQAIADTKFATPQWLYGRSPSNTITYAKRLPCGNVAVHIDIRKGLIAQCAITGDFLGNAPIAAIEALLQGCLYERAALQERLAPIPVQDYLDNTDNDTFINLLLNQ